MVPYGFEFEMKVLSSLKSLSAEAGKTASINEIMSHFIEKNDLNLTPSYKKTLRVRLWRCLENFQSLKLCSKEGRKHPTKNNIKNYYKYNQENGLI